MAHSSQYSENAELLSKYTANLFKVNQHSARLEIQQKKWGPLHGCFGAEADLRKAESSGSRRYLPNTMARNAGIFVMQNVDLGAVKLQTGYRREFANRKTEFDPSYKKVKGLAGRDLSERNYTLDQFRIHGQWNIGKTLYIGLLYTHSERAPEINELYAGNNHYAIMTNENGDDRLRKESANAVELSAGFNYKGISARTSLYHTDYNDYLYLAHTGISRAGFPVKEWRNGDTLLEGHEGEISYTKDFGRAGKWQLSGFYDIVKNRNDSDNSMRKFAEGDYMPNMPVSRYGATLSANVRLLSLSVSMERYMKQHYLGKNISQETAMPGYTMLNARLSYQHQLKNVLNEYYLYGSNLLNSTARPQNSLLRYIAPLPGINIGAGIKLTL